MFRQLQPTTELSEAPSARQVMMDSILTTTIEERDHGTAG